MEKKLYDERPLEMEEIVSVGTRTTIMRFGIEETEEGWNCMESQFCHKEPLAEVGYGRMVDFLVREKYTAGRMEAVINNYLLDPDDVEARKEFEAMQAWRTEAKRLAREQFGGVES